MTVPQAEGHAKSPVLLIGSHIDHGARFSIEAPCFVIAPIPEGTKDNHGQCILDLERL
jgi:hypothetical protein